MRTQKRTRLLSALMALLMVFSLLPASALAAEVEQTLADHVVINQAYGGGGNNGAVYTHDFIELYNPTDEDVDLDGWTVQYASAKGDFKANSGSTRMVTELTGTIKAHGFYLIQEAAGNTPFKDLPTPDKVDTINMGGKEFKIALVKDSDVIKDNNDDSVVDFLGVGTANMYETEAAAAITNSTAAIRVADGVDTDNNKADFKADTPNPRNSSVSGEDPDPPSEPTDEPTTEPSPTIVPVTV
ncbi:MAG: lamin tail domain-containing protein, partial [Lachnospiraceae bacterium]|nr:lamin tail domain-containing protein [Lachnospiraceae bacterium]